MFSLFSFIFVNLGYGYGEKFSFCLMIEPPNISIQINKFNMFLYGQKLILFLKKIFGVSECREVNIDQIEEKRKDIQTFILKNIHL